VPEGPGLQTQPPGSVGHRGALWASGKASSNSLRLWRLPEYDFTYDLDNNTENEERKRKGFRGSMLAVDRTWFRIEKRSYIRYPVTKEVLGLLITMGSVNDL
jgi:hypothetical protein